MASASGSRGTPFTLKFFRIENPPFVYMTLSSNDWLSLFSHRTKSENSGVVTIYASATPLPRCDFAQRADERDRRQCVEEPCDRRCQCGQDEPGEDHRHEYREGFVHRVRSGPWRFAIRHARTTRYRCASVGVQTRWPPLSPTSASNSRCARSTVMTWCTPRPTPIRTTVTP
jgi:hypothetical protein